MTYWVLVKWLDEQHEQHHGWVAIEADTPLDVIDELVEQHPDRLALTVVQMHEQVGSTSFSELDIAAIIETRERAEAAAARAIERETVEPDDDAPDVG